MSNPGEVIAEGKTKRVVETGRVAEEYGTPLVRMFAKDDITAGDGAKHDVMEGKAAWATRTTSNVFRLLKACGIPVAFLEQDGPVSFVAEHCTMLPYEVVVRREAHGSCLKRAPHLEKGHIFPQLVLEFFLKTSGKKWKEHDLPCDDPLMRHDAEAGKVYLYDPKTPDLAQTPAEPFLVLDENEVFSTGNETKLMRKMGQIARDVFLILEKAWQLLGKKLLDYKVEFGIPQDSLTGDILNPRLLLADVIDNDSWRLMDLAQGVDLSKQAYRDDEGLDKVAEKFRTVADLTDRFFLPQQQVILWRGSDKDDLSPFFHALESFAPWVTVTTITSSAHKSPVSSYRKLQQAVSAIPDSVIIAYIGMSNGAGPMLSANTTVPAITVPQSWKEFPEDVWSSLRDPSNVPIMTMLSPKNAVLAALQILAMRNPLIYAMLRLEQEKRLDEM